MICIVWDDSTVKVLGEDMEEITRWDCGLTINDGAINEELGVVALATDEGVKTWEYNKEPKA